MNYSYGLYITHPTVRHNSSTTNMYRHTCDGYNYSGATGVRILPAIDKNHHTVPLQKECTTKPRAKSHLSIADTRAKPLDNGVAKFCPTANTTKGFDENVATPVQAGERTDNSQVPENQP
jgi:hypothetical protein